jgi:hypothetical protein
MTTSPGILEMDWDEVEDDHCSLLDSSTSSIDLFSGKKIGPDKAVRAKSGIIGTISKPSFSLMSENGVRSTI